MSKDPFYLGGVEFRSRLILGTGKYPSGEVMLRSIEASDCQMVTAALRRVDLDNPQDDILSRIDKNKIVILPNTSGARNSKEAIKIAEISMASGLSQWIKLEITPDPRFLLPDGEETLIAAKYLVKSGFKVMPYINADPILAKKLEDVGCVSVMPLGAPIGTNGGLQTLSMIKIIIKQSFIPVIIDAGIGKPSDAAYAMELGASAVMVNTAVATARDPVAMSTAFKLAVNAGRKGYLSGLPSEKEEAEASSPLDWVKDL